MPNYVKIALVKISSFVTVKRFFKHLLFIVLSIFLSHQISASSSFFSIEKRVDRVYNLASTVDDVATRFLNKFGKALPENWKKFNSANHVEFAEKLKNFRGGEGQLFDTPLSDNLVLKRWFGSRVKDMPESIRLLKEAKSLVKKNPKLDKLIDVVSVGERGSDWVVRGFNKSSVPIKNVVNSSNVSKVREEVIEILSMQNSEVAKSMLKKINKNSANIHWSARDKRILIVDML